MTDTRKALADELTIAIERHRKVDGTELLPAHTAVLDLLCGNLDMIVDALRRFPDVSVDRETLLTLLKLLNPLHGTLDKQTYDEKVRNGFNEPGDYEYDDIQITAQMERDLTQAVCILESRLRDDPLSYAKDGSAGKTVCDCVSPPEADPQPCCCSDSANPYWRGYEAGMRAPRHAPGQKPSPAVEREALAKNWTIVEGKMTTGETVIFDGTFIIAKVTRQSDAEAIIAALSQPAPASGPTLEQNIQRWIGSERSTCKDSLQVQPAPVEAWKPIETAPRDGSRLLMFAEGCLRDGGSVVVGYWYKHPSIEGWITNEFDCGDFDFSPTKWMAVPATDAKT